MCVNTAPGATAPAVSLASASVKTAVPAESIRHLLFGTPQSVRATIQQLHQHGYAEPNDWSRPISTGRPNEVMAILTKRTHPRPLPRGVNPG